MNIYVGNLPLEITEEELRGIFSRFGEVKSVIIMNDKYIGSGQTRGYGFVEMVSKSVATYAIANLKGIKIRNREIEVVEALPLSFRNGANGSGVRSNYRSNKSRQREHTNHAPTAS
jgi:RNA recognition motif-containing protein